MARHFTAFLVFALLLQGWAQAGMAMESEPDVEQPCAGHMTGGEDCACCPDGIAAGGSCQILCSGRVALHLHASEIIVTSGQEPPSLIVLVHYGPNYLPLNPPPIA